MLRSDVHWGPLVLTRWLRAHTRDIPHQIRGLHARCLPNATSIEHMHAVGWRAEEARVAASGAAAMSADEMITCLGSCRARSPPPAPRAPHGGGRGSPKKSAGAPFSISSVRQLLRQRCDARGFTLRLIEIIARRKVAPAFEPQKVSGRTLPASQCNAMDASGPSALSCCACSQHEACRDYSNSHVV